MGADETNGSWRRLVGWWFGSVAAAMVVVAVGVWLVGRPNGGTPPSAAGRPDTKGTVVAGSPGAPTSAAAPRQTDTTTAAPPAPVPHAKKGVEEPPQRAAEPVTQAAPVSGGADAPAAHPSRRLASPPAAQARGRVVAGHPSASRRAPRPVQVRQGSVASHGSTVQATLQARIHRQTTALLEQYRSAARALSAKESARFRRVGGTVVTVDPLRVPYPTYAGMPAAPQR
jgi:hypothetical protein